MRKVIKKTAAGKIVMIAITAAISSSTFLFASPSPSMGDTSSDKVYWSNTQAPFMYGTDEATIHAGEKFDIKDSRYRVQARDFEDGDVTCDIKMTSNNVQSDTPGDYKVSYAVTDSDGNTATMDTTVHVIATDSSDNDWYVKRVYQNPNTWNTRELLRMNRGDYMDRQMLGVHLPAGKSVAVSFLDSSSNLAVTITSPTNDTATDGTRTSISSGGTTKISASDSIDTIPLIKTPMLPRGSGTRQQDIRFKVSYSVDDGVGAAHFWTDGDEEKAFIDSWSADDTHPFAYIETKMFEGLPTWSDLSTIKALGTKRGWATSLTAWSEYWVCVMDKYDSMLGVSIRTDDPLNQRVRTKYFCRANVNGAGGAYYNGGDHVGIHNANMWSIFEYNWGGLHEVGHGYQGFMNSGSMYLAEVSNNIYGYQVQHDKSIYKANGEWMNFDNQEKNQNAKRLAGQFKSFDNVDSAGKLYVIMNVFRSITPDNLETAHAEFFTWARRKSQSSGATQNVDMLCRWLADEHGIDASPFFQSWGITIPETTLTYLDANDALDRCLIAGDALTSDASRAAFLKDNPNSPIYSLISSTDAAKYAKGDAEIIVKGNDEIKNRLEGRLAALIGGNGKSEYVAATVPIHNGTAEFTGAPAGNWKAVMPDLSGDGFETAISTVEGRIHITGESSKASYTARYSANGIVSDSSFSIDGIFGTSGFRATIDQSASKLVVSLGGAKLLNWSTAADTVVSSVTLKGKDGSVKKEWTVKGDGYFNDAGNGNESGAFDIEVGDTVDIYFSQYSRVRFYGADGQKQNDNAMTSPNQTYKVTYGGLVRADRVDDKPYNAYAAARISEIRKQLTEDQLDNRFLKGSLKNEASRLYSLMNTGNVDIDEWIKKVRNGGVPTCSTNSVSFDVTPKNGIDADTIFGKIGLLSDAEDGKFAATKDNATVYIDGKPISDIDWKVYAGRKVTGIAYVTDTDGNAAEISVEINVANANIDDTASTGIDTNTKGNDSNSSSDDNLRDNSLNDDKRISGDDNLNSYKWTLPKDKRKRKALVQTGVAAGAEIIAMIAVGATIIAGKSVRRRTK